jgi:hypothetical protein
MIVAFDQFLYYHKLFWDQVLFFAALEANLLTPVPYFD